MEIDERIWTFAQRRLGYTVEEMETFKADPRNADVFSKGFALANKIIVAEVVESHGCNSQHRVGDKFYFDGAGNLLGEFCPKTMCVYAVSSLATLIFAAQELFYAGVDPNEMRFKRVNCIDVGLQCGGWGKVVLELGVQDREATA
ncbi:MAG: TIGR04076 family protein [Thermoflexales bacterium]|nr:TIGR04076 family protein [Thermoflexales bacterium]